MIVHKDGGELLRNRTVLGIFIFSLSILSLILYILSVILVFSVMLRRSIM